MRNGFGIKNILHLCVYGILLLGLSSCEFGEKDVKGYVGSEGTSGGNNGSTPIGNLLVIAPTTPEFVLTENIPAKITLGFSRAVPRDVTLTWKIENATNDFEETEGTVNVPAESESVDISLTAKNDGLYEGEEKFTLQVSGDAMVFLSGVGVPLKIQELLPAPKLSFAGASQTVEESDGVAEIQVNLSQPTDQPVKVSLLVSGSASGSNLDYSIVPTDAVTFDPGEQQKKIFINLVDDSFAEGVEDVQVVMDQVLVGPATIDAANKSYTTYINYSDTASAFSIAGVTGGSDALKDWYLTSGLNPTIYWSDVVGETGYKVKIYNSTGAAIICPEKLVAADITQVSFNSATDCSTPLLEGSKYNISVVAQMPSSTVTAGNDMVTFQIDTVAPSSFLIGGVMGGTDLTPDEYLAGAINPIATWVDATNEAGYKVSVVGELNEVPICAEVTLPANVNAYTFKDCTLERGKKYRIKAAAFDAAGNSINASNNLFQFLVTDVVGGYSITGITGGTGDTSADSSMTDGVNPIVNWENVPGAEKYEVTILNDNLTIKCPKIEVTAPATSVEVNASANPACRLELNEQYKVEVKARDVKGLTYPAINSPYPFTYKVGLYISGTGGSYYRGIPIVSCGGGSNCTITNPYVISEDFFESQIRVSNNGYIVGKAWTTGPVTESNGLLKFSADYLTIDSGGVISMTGKGYPSSDGPGQGTDNTPATGAAHGGYGSFISSIAQAQPYGSVKVPVAMGSGGGAQGANLGGAGGGVINVTVNKQLKFFSGTIESNGKPGAAGSAGGGAGGSVQVNVKTIAGVGGTIAVNGGAGASTGGAGSGGRLAVYYEDATYSGGVTAINMQSRGAGNGSAAGTVFYKKNTDALGYLVVDNGTYNHTEGVETPLPIADSFDNVATRNFGTFILPTGSAYTLPTSTLSYRLVVAGDLTTAAPGTSLIISTTGYLEWRKNASLSTWTDIQINAGGVLTHSSNLTVPKTYYLDIIANTVSVQGLIQANGKGFAALVGPGASTLSMGASYGGLGGDASSGVRGAVYGSLRVPVDLGSGGSGSAGGGSIKITATTLNLAGQIQANGNSASGSPNCSSGTGGSVYIDATTILGTSGSITAVGGDSSCAGGSGGRISIVYTSAPGNIRSIKFRAVGGDGTTSDGAAGTIFLKQQAEAKGHLLVYNESRAFVSNVTTLLLDADAIAPSASDPFDTIETDYTGTVHVPAGRELQLPNETLDYRLVLEGDYTLPAGMTNLTVENGGYLESRRNTPLSFNNFTVKQGGIVTHAKNTGSTKDFLLQVNANNIRIDGTVDVSGRGYAANNGTGKPSSGSYGAGYGGFGGNVNLHEVPYGGSPYGMTHVSSPDELGSGSTGSSGGGLISLNATGTLTLNGMIMADGADGSSSGGGSGGSVNLVAATIDGSGVLISANGGIGSDSARGSGSGGRIAITCSTDNFAGGLSSLIAIERIRAFGGTRYTNAGGAAGTIFLKNSVANGKVYINNGPNPYKQHVDTPMPKHTDFVFDRFYTLNNATVSLELGDNEVLPEDLDYRIAVRGTATFTSNNLNIKNGGLLEWSNGNTITLDNLKIESGGILSHSNNYTSVATSIDYKLDITINQNFTLDAGGKIDIAGRGHKPGVGKGTAASAAYGGRTANSTTVYGDLKNPVDLGSGGTGGTGGGGLLHLTVAGTTTLNGVLDATGSGGGSGGSIYIDTDVLAGSTALVSADGGAGASNGASGGRIAFLYNTDNYGLLSMNLTAYGGNVGTPGGAGTIFYRDKDDAAHPNGHLIVKNFGRAYTENTTTYLPDNGTLLDSITVDQYGAVEIPAGFTTKLPNEVVSYRMILNGDVQLPAGKDTLIVANNGIIEQRNCATAFGLPNVPKITVQSGGLITSSATQCVNLNLTDLTVYGIISVDGKGSAQLSHGGRGYPDASVLPKTGASIKNPNTVAGGTKVLINVSNDLTLNGTISANGGGSNRAGGSLNITTNNMKGSGGKLKVDGGANAGGGYLALRYTNDLYAGGLSSLSMSAKGNNYGSAGFIFIKATADANGHLIINNGGGLYKEGYETEIYNLTAPETLDFDTVTVGSSSTGVYITTGVTFKFNNSTLNFPLRVAGDPVFPNFDGTHPQGDLTITSGGSLNMNRSAPLKFNNFVYEPGASLLHAINTTVAAGKKYINIEAENIHLKKDSVIDVSYRGYDAGQGTGAGTLMSLWNYAGGGAGYGGAGGGGVFTTGPVRIVNDGGPTYGDAKDPVDPGSGGTSNPSTAGANTNKGGGLVRFKAYNELILEGRIQVNGQDSNNCYSYSASYSTMYCGAGSGGAINLETNILSGGFAELVANGGSSVPGSSKYFSGSGGGGRISVKYLTNNYFDNIIYSVSGGNANVDRKGSDGTYYFGAP